jgi:hypothetical protein
MSNPWALAGAGVILSATLFLAWDQIGFGQEQQAAPEVKDKKPVRLRLNLEKPKQAEPTLEEMLNKALKDNPDIRVAESKVREAEAELNRTRLQVTQKVLAFHHNHEAQKAAVKVAEEDLGRVRKLQKSAVLSQEEVTQAENRLSQAKAKLAEIEAEMPYLLGQQRKVLSFGNVTDTINVTDMITEVKLLDASAHWSRLKTTGRSEIQPVAGTTLDKIRKALDTPVSVDYKDKDLTEILKDLERKVAGISFHNLVGGSGDLHLDGAAPLGAVLQLVEDTFTDPARGDRCAFAIREYGILFTRADRIPPGAILLDDLLKEKAFAERQNKEPEDKKSTGDKK